MKKILVIGLILVIAIHIYKNGVTKIKGIVATKDNDLSDVMSDQYDYH